MNTSEIPIIIRLSHIGMFVYRVTNDSKKPATIKTGTKPIIILTPCFAPLINDSALENVPGYKMLLPSVNPAQPAITMADISNVP